ncbi:MAG: hypothetical protein K1Y02_00215 [Candidatus Hydrogenedentes bacterium]|nr:hypothetical protein [Candidatus Hydrogenedentota bacterium]
MECLVCQIRSSVGFCAECQGLLCETCGVPCEQCGSPSCPTHIHETRSGRKLCIKCYEDRQAKRAQAKAAAERAHDDEAVPAQVTPEVAEVALVGSARKMPQPWQVSLYIASAGLLAVLLMFVFPSFRRIPLGPTSYIPTPYVMLLIPLIAVVWATVGIIRVEFFRDRSKCFIGIGLAVLTLILSVVAVRTDPAAAAQAQVKSMEEVRKQMTPDQLKDWRERTLKRYE